MKLAVCLHAAHTVRLAINPESPMMPTSNLDYWNQGRPDERTRVRTTASIAQALWREIGDKSFATRNLINQLQHQTNLLEEVLIGSEQRRNQLIYQCNLGESVSFYDADSPESLIANFEIIDPISSNAVSGWRRGARIQSQTGGPRNIEQITEWSAPSVAEGTMLLLKNMRYPLSQTFIDVGLKPMSNDISSAGVVLGYQNPSNFYYLFLTLTESNECTATFGRLVTGKDQVIKSMSCAGVYGNYHQLSIESEPLKYLFFFDGQPIGEVRSETGEYTSGRVGLLSLRGATAFGSFSVGGHRATLARRRPGQSWKDSIVELYEISPSKSEDSNSTAGGAGSSEVKRTSDTGYRCFTYKPTHIMPDDLVCESNAFWRLENGADSTSVTSAMDLKASQKPRGCVIRDWSCRDSEIRMRITFNSDGEAGIILRSHNAALRTVLTLETISQKVTLSQLMPTIGMQPLYQVVSPLPLIAHETNGITVRDVGGKVTVLINNEKVFDAWIENKAERLIPRQQGFRQIAHGGGFVLMRGNVKIENLEFRGI